jgi:hypothetical protein
MKLALVSNLIFTSLCINLQKYVIHYLNFMSICLFELIRVEGGREVRDTC